MLFPSIWPVKVITRGKLVAILHQPSGPHPEQWILYTIEVKIKPRVNDTINDFFLEIRTQSRQKIRVPSCIIGENELKKGTRLTKNQNVGPLQVDFEIDSRQQGISGTNADDAREILKNVKPFIILKTGCRNQWPISKRLYFR